jgi:hypothetical protein
VASTSFFNLDNAWGDAIFGCVDCGDDKATFERRFIAELDEVIVIILCNYLKR